MPRANRHYLPGYIWHITHRCHHRRFRLRYARDRRDWVAWLYESRRPFGLCVLDYCVTSNHIHLLVRDQDRAEIAASMQLIAGRIGQAFNERKHHHGAFWADRYHATAVDTEAYLARCVVYIDLNMVRAGVVEQPSQWECSGYHEIQAERRRYRIVDRTALAEALGLDDVSQLASQHREWIDQQLQQRKLEREACWTESLAVGGREFVEGVKVALGASARYRDIEPSNDGFILRDAPAAYTSEFGLENGRLRPRRTSCSA